jgi:hypothetical protein
MVYTACMYACLISPKSFLKEQPREMNIQCKKRLTNFRPHTGCHYPNSPWTGKIKLIPARESLVSDIPAGDEKMANLFYRCIIVRHFTS